MRILQILFEGYRANDNSFADCVILIKEQLFSNKSIFDISSKAGFPIVSEVRIYLLNETLCRAEGGEFWDGYKFACENEYFFIKYIDKKVSEFSPYKVPRFSESDFENLICKLGGTKILEATTQTPDFLLNGVVYELKDIQSDSLFNKERQNKIGEIFQSQNSRTINLNPQMNYGVETIQYHQLIKNSVHKHFKKASDQIKSYKLQNQVTSAGIIVLNTGMFSMPHDLLKVFVQQLLTNTQTIDFAFIFTQIMQGTWSDAYAVYGREFLGNIPMDAELLKKNVDDLVNFKMSQMMQGIKFESIIDSMKPISFQENNKIFYWNPGRIQSSFLKEAR